MAAGLNNSILYVIQSDCIRFRFLLLEISLQKLQSLRVEISLVSARYRIGHLPKPVLSILIRALFGNHVDKQIGTLLLQLGRYFARFRVSEFLFKTLILLKHLAKFVTHRVGSSGSPSQWRHCLKREKQTTIRNRFRAAHKLWCLEYSPFVTDSYDRAKRDLTVLGTGLVQSLRVIVNDNVLFDILAPRGNQSRTSTTKIYKLTSLGECPLSLRDLGKAASRL